MLAFTSVPASVSLSMSVYAGQQSLVLGNGVMSIVVTIPIFTVISISIAISVSIVNIGWFPVYALYNDLTHLDIPDQTTL